MNQGFIKNEDACYQKAEQDAASYFQHLCKLVKEKTYIPVLKNDFQSWKQNHIRHSLLPFFPRPKSSSDFNDYRQYIQWLYSTRKLDQYLERSVAYIFLRDLGKALDSPETEKRIRRFTASLRKKLLQSSGETDAVFKMFSHAGLFRWGQKEGLESTVIWLFEKLKRVALHLPSGMDVEQAKRKLIKMIGGVVMHELDQMENDLSSEERRKRLERAVRLGYSYGLTYPFIDDLLDSEVLTEEEKEQYSRMIRSTLLTGKVPEIGKWKGKNHVLMHFIHAELREAFEYMKANQRQETRRRFFEQAYVFFQSQEDDRRKDLAHPYYTNEEIYIPVIIKSFSSRVIVRSVVGAVTDKDFEERIFFYGLYNQLADDFADMFDDLRNGAVTPYTYFLKYHQERPDLVNPFQLYWAVISYLIHHVYRADEKTREVILARAINGLRRFKVRIGKKKYQELMELFMSDTPDFNRMIQYFVQKAENVDFLDKLIRDHMLQELKKEQMEQEQFEQIIKSVQNEINQRLPIAKDGDASLMKTSIIDAANYSLTGAGKRLRPIITWMMGVEEFGLNREGIVPMLRALEYMHTASLIFDDLPAQDNSAVRRGRPTLHHVYSTAEAELTGLFLTQKAVKELASLNGAEAEAVLRLIQYSSQVTMDMCMGQAMDLASKGKRLSLEELNTMCFYKTGIAFEASLIMPAIIAGLDRQKMEILKKFAYHAGIAFQIKDDLLDMEGNINLLGKPVGKDVENDNSTFVTVLGLEGAKIAMWEHYCCAVEAIQEFPCQTAFLKYLLDYFVNRDR